MKAIRISEFGDPDVMKLEEVEDPEPSEGEAVVRIHAVGVNPVETYIRSGAYAMLPELPYTPGADGAGVIESVGEGVRRFSVGDRVYLAGSASGSYAEMSLCSEVQIHPLLDPFSFDQGAALGIPYATAYRALFQRAQSRAGESVLVHGATGGVGLASVQLARAHGMTVIGTGGTPEGRDLVAREGAHHVIDHHAAGYLDEILELTEGRGVDLVLEMLANVNLGKDLTLLARGGRVVVIGSRGTVEINPRDIMGREASIIGMHLLKASPEELASSHAGIGAGLENETLRPVVAKQLPLEQAPRAHEEVLATGALGKIVLLP
jgi:NADPH2:quinone reductase